MMKALKLVALCLLIVFAFVPVASAGGGGTTQIRHYSCVILPEDSGVSQRLWTWDTAAVVTAKGNTLLRCHFKIPPGMEPTKNLHHKGFKCSTFAGLTRNSRAVTTAGGKVHLTCQINGSRR